ncbi:Retrovirus-related Pol polyprotein from transposon 17.6 [Gossypium australe]|uniref:Retrovirus-related Pol polyprotein from transposon 17.6 n=1 Tax=Gossypium australe TaxID=47621 RepID=A0A5B6WQP7_9ROSI|nr:Retrovirus-related Pol polyprotein from transposon 17.6 [Gossypium australe]
MCDASDYAIGAVLGQKREKIFFCSIHYTKMLAIMLTCDKFRPYFMANRVCVYIYHSALKYVMKKNETKARQMRWVLLLQDFDLWIIDRKGTNNQIANHLSRWKNGT